MSEKKPGITMKDAKPAAGPAPAPKVKKPGITTNMINAPAPRPRPEAPAERGQVITTNDKLPRDTEGLLRELEDMPYAEAFAKKIDEQFKADAVAAPKAKLKPGPKPAMRDAKKA